MGRCRSCDALVYWAVTRGDRKIPVDIEPTANGNIWFATDPDGNEFAEFMSKHNTPPEGTPLHVSHFGTCPQRDQWRNDDEKPTQQGLL